MRATLVAFTALALACGGEDADELAASGSDGSDGTGAESGDDGTAGDSAGDGEDEAGTDGPPELCADEPELCTGDCPAAPTVDPVAEWHNRLTESPTVSWSATGSVQVAVGSAPGETDYACWTNVEGEAHTFIDLFLTHGETYYFSVRALDAEGRAGESAAVSWTVDAVAPVGIESVLDDAIPVDGSLSWNAAEDPESGLAGYRVALGTEPLGTDVLDWTDADEPEAVLDFGAVDVGTYYASVRAVDIAGNQSNPIASGGFIVCPEHFAYVPANADEGIATPSFCVMRYEARVDGNPDGLNVADAAGASASAEPVGTPWTGLSRPRASAACMELGEGYASPSTSQWQAIARNLESTAANWSGGAVGQGALARGHSDGDPGGSIAVDPADPCAGTGQTNCDDPSSPDFQQRRELRLSNRDRVWDFAGNADEWVLSSAGAPDVLWTEFSAAVFNQGEEAETYRARFAPAGDFDSTHGMGQFYGGGTAFARGGSAGDGSRAGIFAGMHNAWNEAPTRGFRCVFSP
ncbi:MAG: hypothetical protein AAF721_04515 [Myxococcota bacterium]